MNGFMTLVLVLAFSLSLLLSGCTNKPSSDAVSNISSTPADKTLGKQGTNASETTSKSPQSELPLSTCSRLDAANTKYILSNDVSSNSTCFDIVSDNVTLDCRGHVLYGHQFDGPTIYGIRIINRSGIRVGNCIISEFGTGIRMDGGRRNELENNTLNKNQDIEISYSDENRISNNILKDGVISINLYSARGTQVYGNTISNGTGGPLQGIRLQKSADNRVYNNTILGAANDGIYLEYSEGNILSLNRVNQSKRYGIYFFHSSNNSLVDNVLSLHEKAIEEEFSSKNVMSNNTIILLNKTIITR